MTDFDLFSDCFAVIGDEVNSAVGKVDPAEAENFCCRILEAEGVFVIGAGRSGLVGRMFTMRLMHLGLTACFVGDVTTPSIGKGDLLVALSGSGLAATVITVAESAKKHGAFVVALSTDRDTLLARSVDEVFVVPGIRPAQSKQLLHSIFDQSLLLTLDCITMMLARKMGKTRQQMADRHTNL